VEVGTQTALMDCNVGMPELAARNVKSFAPTTLKFLVMAMVLGGGGGGGAT